MVLAPPNEGSFLPSVAVPSSFLNTNIRDAITFLANPPLCVCYASSVQSIPNATWTSLLFNNNKIDSYGGHSTVTNTSRYTAVEPGWYSVHVTGVAGTATVNNWAARLAVNGTAVLGSASDGPAYGGGSNATAEADLDVFLNIGDYVEGQVVQSSGAAMNTSATALDFTSCMKVRWVHV